MRVYTTGPQARSPCCELFVFLNERAQDSAYFIDIKESKKKQQRKTKHAGLPALGKAYSRKRRNDKSLASAAIQSEASTLILLTKEGTEDSLR
jgi:hypothetical protein